MIDPLSLKMWFNQVCPTLTQRQISVLEIFEHDPDGDFTNAEIGVALDWSINRITGRVQELRGEGARKGKTALIEFSRRRECHVTHNEANAWKLRFAGVPVRPQRPVPETYRVPSKTEVDRSYKIRDGENGPICNCMGFYRRGHCSHVDKWKGAQARPEDVHTSLFETSPVL